MKNTRLIFWLSAVFALASCSTDFQVYDTPRDIVAAYCVLNPDDSVQYVRLQRAYQVEGDAIAFGGANDMSLKGMPLKLSGNGNTWIAEQVDSFPIDSGVFFPYPTVYRFRTDGTTGNPRVVPGQTYTLEVGAQDSTMYFSAQTRIPSGTKFTDKFKQGTFMNLCLYKAELDKKYRMIFQKGSDAYAYELRVTFNYEENGIPKSVIWGPTQLFSSNQRCVSGNGEICYQMEQYELIGYWNNFLDKNSGSLFQYDETPECTTTADTALLPHSVRLEVTAVDSELGKYMTVNNPRFTDPSGSKPEYTNFSGNVMTVGIFGSRITDHKYVLLSDCTEYLIGLQNTTIQPSGCTPP